MSFQSIIKNIYRNIKIKQYIFTNKFRVPSDYDSTSTKFVNEKNLASTTQYLIWVDTKSFQVNIFKGSKKKWIFNRKYTCSIGKTSTPTPKGLFKVGAKGYSFGENHGYICYYYTQFLDNYLFHSILYNLDNTVRDGRLGYEISNGCIRLAKTNALWIYKNIPYGTTVYIT
ncbi:L,D-transpeptidase [Clostridioides difficile]